MIVQDKVWLGTNSLGTQILSQLTHMSSDNITSYDSNYLSKSFLFLFFVEKNSKSN